ncbi:MAG: UbiA family prenyltransferase [Flavobacteriaceae bacterium]|nr:UbiA family prenyltransferase [Flavobacteriaceae bacterium]
MITKLFRFYILSSSHVALAVLSLSYLTHLHFDISWQTDLFVFIFCATVGTYNFIRYYASLSITASFNIPFLFFSFLSVLGMGLSATKLTSQTLLVAFLLGMMSLTYVLPSNRFFRGLRYLPYLKSFIVAACWASVVVILPLLNHQIEFDRAAWLIWLQMALWTFSTMIPFEIRDISNDCESMKTIPQVLGVRGAKIFGILMLFGVVVLSYFLSLQSYDMIPTLIASVLALVCLWVSTVDQSTYYASFWVEALPMVWLLMVVVWEWI